MNIKWLFSVFVCVVLVGVVPVVMASSGPTEVLKPKLNASMAVLSDPSLAGNEQKDVRRAKFMDIAMQVFNFKEMSKRVLGQTWRKIDPLEREHFTRLFTKLLENAYLGKLEEYSGQTIVYKDERVKGKKAAVSTVIYDENTFLPVNYVMLNTDTGWRVYDINIEGVSLIRNYREQFKSILRKKKFDGLVKIIEEKNSSFDVEEFR
ncbi:MAG: ABC transporter substrate-binding protein [Thermodesulfobacteriota bacterium]|nr:ABC transporter substrate-binding protein [Thermodesulfobacteriota bacterium]